MKKLELTVELRTKNGSNASHGLRQTGKVPGVVYGKIKGKQEALSISVEEKTLLSFLRKAAGSVVLIELKIEGLNGSKLAVLQATQRNPITDRYTHIDLHEIATDEPMHAHIPVHIVGESFGVRNEDGLLETHATIVDVRCLPAKLPEFIEVDISDLKVGQAIHVSDLKEIEGVEFIGNQDTIIITCVSQKAVAEKADKAAEEAETVVATEPANAAKKD